MFKDLEKVIEEILNNSNQYKGISKEIKEGEFIKNKKQYTIIKPISIGYTNVYLATDGEKEVVIKQFFNINNDFLRLQDELQNLSHPMLIDIYDSFEYKGFYFQVKPYYDNYIDLDTLIFNLTSREDRLNLIKELGEFINYLHSKNIAHTDLKPEQFIYIPKTDEIKLLDFDFGVIEGICYYPGGTKEWYSPEHIKKEAISIKSDIFTFAEIAHYILTTKHPFEHSFDDNFEESILNENYQLLELKALFSKMLSANPSNRISISQFLNSLDKPPSKIYLCYKDKKYLIIKSTLITRDLCKYYFQNHKNIAPKHFEIIKKSDGWYLRGLEDKRFNPVIVDGIDATNKEIKLNNNSIIKIDSTEFKIEFKE